MAVPSITSTSWTNAEAVNHTGYASGTLSYTIAGQSGGYPDATYANYVAGTKNWDEYWMYNTKSGSVSFSYSASSGASVTVSCSVSVQKKILVAGSTEYTGTSSGTESWARGIYANGGEANKIYTGVVKNANSTWSVKYKFVENSSVIETYTVTQTFQTSGHMTNHYLQVTCDVSSNSVYAGGTVSVSYYAYYDGIAHSVSVSASGNITYAYGGNGYSSYNCDTIGSASFYAYATENGITVSSEVCAVNITEPPEPESDPFTWGDDISGNSLHMKNGHPSPVTAAKMNDFISRVNDKCNKNISGVTAGAVIDRSSTGQLAKCATALGVAYNEKKWGYKSFWQALEDAVNGQ